MLLVSLANRLGRRYHGDTLEAALVRRCEFLVVQHVERRDDPVRSVRSRHGDVDLGGIDVTHAVELERGLWEMVPLPSGQSVASMY
jgi:hypothetical protein